MRYNKFLRLCTFAAAVGLASACATDQGTKSSTCSVYDSTRQSTEYSARLVRAGSTAATSKGDETGARSGQYELQIQAVHPKTMASRIKRLSLNDGTTPEIRLLEDSCICGMQIRKVDVDCTHITNYLATVSEQTLAAVMDNGLAMTFTLENGRIIAGPKIEGDEIRAIMGRS